MPRKPKLKKEIMMVYLDDREITVYLHPPSGTRKSWYVYWPGLKNPKSTGVRTLAEAKSEATRILRGGEKTSKVTNNLLTDQEFEEIQRQHFGKKTDPDAVKRAEKSLRCCLEAISAFREISGVKLVSTATADDCERFQRAARELPKNWRSQYPNSKSEGVAKLSPNTIIKWSVALQAAFERANRNAERKKCVLGVVPREKLLTSNPWKEFTWIDKREKEIRQFTSAEMLSVLDYFEDQWPCVPIAQSVAKVFLWSWGRKAEVAGLKWDMLRRVDDETHFEIIGKWAVDKWFRIPTSLYGELLQTRCDSPFVFAAYSSQLRNHHRNSHRPWLADRVAADFAPENLGDWFYERIKDWSASSPSRSAYLHMFRKTTLQYARAGEDTNSRLAADARLGERVMMTSYVKETDPQMREKSNRMFRRIAESLPDAVARRYGYTSTGGDLRIEQLNAAMRTEDWATVSRISAELQSRDNTTSNDSN